jgi:hypothetical protein
VHCFGGERGRKEVLGRCGCSYKDSVNVSLKKWDSRAWTGLIWFGIGPSGGLL